jgi:hypothetical protein
VPQGTIIKKYATRGFASGKVSTHSTLSDDGTSPSHSNRLDIPLLAETVLVTISVILVFVVSRLGYFSTINWLVTPGILVAAALIPTVLKGRKLAQIGLDAGHIGASLRLLSVVCLAVFPATFLFL